MKNEEKLSERDCQNVSEKLANLDPEMTYRNLTGYVSRMIWVIALSFSLFQLYTAIFGVLDAQMQRAIHLSFVLGLLFLLYPATRKMSRINIHWSDYILSMLGFLTPLYIVIFYEDLILRAAIVTPLDFVIGVIGILLVLEAGRRIVGLPMVIIAIIFIIYALFGEIFPGAFFRENIQLRHIVQHLFYTTEGIFGIPLGVSSTFLFMFLLFAAFLQKTGIGSLFMNLASALAGWATGGPAKIAVITSALEGTVTGSSIANVVGCGTFTIPLMKRVGYKPEFAAAAEAAASTGGQIMPPIMGAAAFLMSEFLGIPYLEVAKAAIIPALLYFTGVWFGLHYQAKKQGLRGLPRAELPKLGKIIIEEGHLIIPLIGLIYILVAGYSLMRVALVGIALSILASWIRKSTRMSFYGIIDSLIVGARSALSVAAACAIAGIIVGIVTQTGVGLKLASAIVDLANNQLILTMFFTMLTSLLLGMGVPTTANYIITSTIAAPALLTLGVTPIAAHMFVFYFGIIADLTPPVALAAYAASAIARANPFKTGVIATRLAIGAFLIPYIFVLSPQLLMIEVTLFNLALIILTSIVGMASISGALAGFFVSRAILLERVALFIAGLVLIYPGWQTDIIGFTLVGSVSLFQWFRLKQEKAFIPA
ncbi:MAG: Sialic acid TRAP transporter permease protein SiaT [candidate division WS2 bacterium]|nr:Sialic acid TRAP transporter permease protein SiaT [Candidatus Psychracetigena formicireducens]